MGREVSAARAATKKQVVCVLADEQRHSYRTELAQLESPGVDFLFEDSPESAIDLVGQCDPDVVLVGMTVGMMDGLEVLALLMQKHPTFSGKIVVLPDKGDPFPPMLQYRDPVSGKSTTESVDFAGVEALIRKLAPAPAPAAAQPTGAAKQVKVPRDKAPPIPIRAKPRLRARVAPKPAEKQPAAVPAVVAPAPAPAPTAAPSPSAAQEPVAVARGGDGAKDLAALVEQTLKEPPAPAPTSQDILAEVTPPAARVEPPAVAHEVSAVLEGRKRSRVVLFAALALGGLLLVFVVLFSALRSATDTKAVAAPTAKETAKSSQPAARASAPAPTPTPVPPPQATVAPEPTAQDLSKPTPLPLAFSKRSAEYTIVNRGQLDALTAALSGALEKKPRARVEVGGHSSEEGAEWLNLEISERRATAVQDYLAKQGISPTRMVLKSYGSSVPSKTSGTDPESDRRVTVRVLESGPEGEP